MIFQIEKVLERDVDLYIINKFINDVNFKNLFLEKIGCEKYDVNKCIHSFSDENGENDVTIVLSSDKEKIGLLIEDKISAIAMPNQYERYKTRGNKLIKDGYFDKYYIFIIAPAIYLSSNAEAKKYDYKISYEDILDHIRGDKYGEGLIGEAINEKKKGYSVIENKNITLFWKEYYDYVEKYYPELNIKRHDGPRGHRSGWPIFNTPIKKLKIVHKSNMGNVDLELPGFADAYFDINKLLKNYIKDNMKIETAGKSLAIRIKVKKIDFDGNFSDYIEEMNMALDAVRELYQLVLEYDFNQIIK